MEAQRHELPPGHLPQAPCKGQPKTHDCVSHSVSLRLTGVIWSPLVRISFTAREAKVSLTSQHTVFRYFSHELPQLHTSAQLHELQIYLQFNNRLWTLDQTVEIG